MVVCLSQLFTSIAAKESQLCRYQMQAQRYLRYYSMAYPICLRIVEGDRTIFFTSLAKVYDWLTQYCRSSTRWPVVTCTTDIESDEMLPHSISVPSLSPIIFVFVLHTISLWYSVHLHVNWFCWTQCIPGQLDPFFPANNPRGLFDPLVYTALYTAIHSLYSTPGVSTCTSSKLCAWRKDAIVPIRIALMFITQ